MIVPRTSGRRGLPKTPVNASLNDQPRSAISTPAGSFQANTAALTDRIRGAVRHSTVPSAPMMRTSSPIQLLIAEGVSVHGLVQPISVFSSDTGGKKAPPFTDQRHAVVETGR